MKTVPPAIWIITHHYSNINKYNLKLLYAYLVKSGDFYLNYNVCYQMLQKCLRLENVPQDPISNLVNLMTYGGVGQLWQPRLTPTSC